MDFQFTEQEEAFRKEVSDFLDREVPPEWMGRYIPTWEATKENFANARSLYRKLGEKGWLVLTWPKEYGGIGGTAMQYLILREELGYRGAQDLSAAVGFLFPAIALFGTEKQKEVFLPQIARGEIEICMGYSEPEAGSDLTNAQSRAVELDDCYVINGQKIFTSAADMSEYCFFLARTDPKAYKHKGLSMFLVDMKTPGITIRPLISMYGSHSTNETFWDDVRVPKDCMVGEKNQGWKVLTTALNHERLSVGGISFAAAGKKVLESLVRFAKENSRNGRILAEDPVVRSKLAEIAIEMEIARLLSYNIAWLEDKGSEVTYQASALKLYTSELVHRFANVAMNILGPRAQLKKDSNWALLNGNIEHIYLASVVETVGGGTSEVQKDLVAVMGLGLPKRR